NPPVVFFIQGYTCQTVEMPNWNPIKKLIGDWLKAGFAVYMVEKPGMGDSQSDMPCMQIDFNGELKAFSQAYSTLQQNKQIDSKNIFLFGHSMGGVIAPLLSQVNKPKGIMVYGIMGKNWYDYMLDIFTEQRKLLGATDEEISEALKYDQPFIYDMLIRKKTNHELISTANYAGHLEQKGIAKDLKEGYYLQRHYTFWQTLADVDISKAWAKVEAPVYVLHGEYDIQAIAPEHGKLIVTHVIAHGGNARFEVIPKTEHAFLHFDSMEQNIQVRSDGTYRNALASRYNPEVAKLSIEWMKQLLEE
ncbi:MAG: alpha/beta hydrolase family protein, partial [Bacteroidales bacterium]